MTRMRLAMRNVRTNHRHVELRRFVAALTCMTIAGAVLADLMVTNAAGVRAGITGIVYRRSDNSIAVQFAVRDLSGTNVTTLAIQRSLTLTNWADYATLTVTGNYPIAGTGSAEISDFATSPAQFYRMRLINF